MTGPSRKMTRSTIAGSSGMLRTSDLRAPALRRPGRGASPRPGAVAGGAAASVDIGYFALVVFSSPTMPATASS
ncbi:hypothetical protein GCM10009750_16140 [Agromyces salentinus]|uniref:Uncharacterized protein n=1 Tax=Agromyces salentinus TaxID=269421 RepID=A0ABN2MN48_9MICO